MNARAHIVGLLLGATCLGACGISSHSVDAAAAESPAADAGDAGDASDVADAGDAPDAADAADAAEELPEKELAPNCPAPTRSCPASPEWVLRTLLKASDYGAGARFTALGGGAVLVASDAGSKVVWAGLNPDSWSESWPLPAGYRGVDVIDHEEPTYGVYVLAVSEASDEVTLWQGASGETALAPVAGGALPPHANARGVTADVPSYGKPSRPCVYGAGLACFDGASWQQLIPQEVRLQRAVLGDALGLGVADDGSIWVAKRQGETRKFSVFRKLDEKVSGVLRSVDVGAEQAILVTDAGMWRFSPSGKVVSCPLDTGLAAVSLVYEEHALHSDGRVLRYSEFSDTWCESQTLETGGEVLGYSKVPCGPEVNPRVLTADKLFGSSTCVYL